jgi:hypothetical protein
MSDKQKDNSTGPKKIALRRAALREIAAPSIVETHGGFGHCFLNCYSSHDRGAVFETDERKSDRLADQRPGWAVYQNDCVEGLGAGVGFQFAPNFFDVDPFGECWPTINAIFSGLKMKGRPPRVVLVVNDGLRHKVRGAGSWISRSLKAKVMKYGNDKMWKIYLDVCKELVEEMGESAGYRLKRWTGYYCGRMQQMTHFACVLDLIQSPGVPPC